MQLDLFGRADAGGFRATIAARELFNPASSVDEFLFAGEKRMTCRANANFYVLLRRTGVVDSTTGARNVGLVILRMNVRFHVRKGVPNLGALRPVRKG